MCPFVNQTDARCAEHLTLRNLSQAFGHCAGRFAECLVFRQLSADAARRDKAARTLHRLAS